MKTRLRFLQVLFASVLLTALTVQSWHGWADYQEKVRERHCEHKAYSKASITHTHASLEHCSVCDFTFAPYAAFTIWPDHSEPTLRCLDRTVAAYQRFVPSGTIGLRYLRGPPSVNV
ncbi:MULTISPECIES: hypothetical protein [unclassified Flavobacterium]|uniref:hypothetical protein n=1 Tax=unclassified Flavobacterium TaxID=196869 RepID=UPI001F142981|nr:MULTISPECIES: hypothetical protein [unclassified Flavobacterium]UMY66186.1 hypothetical protein MKO97_02060 [Flavobacterium sp. HJ-32-4]